MRHPLLLVWLVVVWVALWGDLTVGNVVAGAALAVALQVALPLSFRHPDPVAIRPLPLLRFFRYFGAKLVHANIDVARHIITPRDTLKEGIIAVPLRDPHDDLVTTVFANAITLTPGTLTLEVETREVDGRPVRTLYVHVLHLAAPDKLRRDLSTLEYLALLAFGSGEARAAATDPRAGQVAPQGRESR